MNNLLEGPSKQRGRFRITITEADNRRYPISPIRATDLICHPIKEKFNSLEYYQMHIFPDEVVYQPDGENFQVRFKPSRRLIKEFKKSGTVVGSYYVFYNYLES